MKQTSIKLDNGNTIIYDVTDSGTAYHKLIILADGTIEHRATPVVVIDILERARDTQQKLRLFYGDENGRDWCEEHDMCGYISRSMGPVKIPILLKNRQSIDGGGILEHCIVKIMCGQSVFYQQDNYQMPQFRVALIQQGAAIGKTDLRKAGYTHSVDRLNEQWENVANFKSGTAAQRYIDFMTGKSNRH